MPEWIKVKPETKDEQENFILGKRQRKQIYSRNYDNMTDAQFFQFINQAQDEEDDYSVNTYSAKQGTQKRAQQESSDGANSKMRKTEPVFRESEFEFSEKRRKKDEEGFSSTSK